MGLELNNKTPGLFTHSNRAETGITSIEGTGNIRSATYVVSQDGKGDFDDIQEAIDALPPGTDGGGLIYVKNGVYDKRLYLNGRPNIRIIGSGSSTIIKDTSGGNEVILCFNSTKNIFENLRIERENGQDGIKLSSSFFARIINCFIKDADDAYGLILSSYGIVKSTYINCSATSQGIRIIGVANIITDNIIQLEDTNGSTYGIMMQNGSSYDRNIISNNYIYDNTNGDGINAGSDNNLINGNIFYDCNVAVDDNGFGNVVTDNVNA